MLRKIFFSTMTIMAIAIGAVAQTGHHTEVFNQMADVAWDVNFPINNKFVSKTSFEGFKFELRRMIKSGISAGFEVGWNTYYQYVPRQTYQIQDGAVTTDLYTYIYTLPLALNVHHYFNINKMVTTYAGLALGATYSQQKIYYNTYVSQDENWGFLVRPELGAIIKFQEGMGLLVGARYSYSTNSQKTFQINGLQSFGLQLGLVFMK
jgi:hypothetical protein